VRSGHPRAFFLLALLATAGCPSSNIDFHICGDLGVPDDIDGVRLLVLDQERELISSGVRSLVDDQGAPTDSLPVTGSLRSGSGSGWAEVQGLSGGVAVITFGRRVGDLEGTPWVDMVLTQDCLGQDCPLGQTCVAGACILAPVGDEAPTCGGSY
jgi:hypothetical protein